MIFPPGLEDDEASYVERFKKEARIMGRMSHPAVVPVHDFGETSEGQFFIVMEFVDGTDVQKMLQAQDRLPAEHALAVTAHVCDALAYAHKHGVIHRDIKPANVLINMEGAVKVADFGLAKAQEAGAGGITKTGMAMGPQAPDRGRVRQNVDERPHDHALASAASKKSKTPLIISIAPAAAIAVGAFVMSSRSRKVVDGSPRAFATPTDQTLASSATEPLTPAALRLQPSRSPVRLMSNDSLVSSCYRMDWTDHRRSIGGREARARIRLQSSPAQLLGAGAAGCLFGAAEKDR